MKIRWPRTTHYMSNHPIIVTPNSVYWLSYAKKSEVITWVSFLTTCNKEMIYFIQEVSLRIRPICSAAGECITPVMLRELPHFLLILLIHKICIFLARLKFCPAFAEIPLPMSAVWLAN